MRLRTIWTLRAMTLRERLHRTSEWAAQKVAAALPKRVRYWAFIQQASGAIGPNEVVPEVRLLDVLDRI